MQGHGDRILCKISSGCCVVVYVRAGVVCVVVCRTCVVDESTDVDDGRRLSVSDVERGWLCTSYITSRGRVGGRKTLKKRSVVGCLKKKGNTFLAALRAFGKRLPAPRKPKGKPGRNWPGSLGRGPRASHPRVVNKPGWLCCSLASQER